MAKTNNAQNGPASRNSPAISPAAEEKSPAMAWVMTATMPAKDQSHDTGGHPPTDIAPGKANTEIDARPIAPKSSNDQRPAGQADPGNHRPHQGGNRQRCIQKQQRNRSRQPENNRSDDRHDRRTDPPLRGAQNFAALRGLRDRRRAPGIRTWTVWASLHRWVVWSVSRSVVHGIDHDTIVRVTPDIADAASNVRRRTLREHHRQFCQSGWKNSVPRPVPALLGADESGPDEDLQMVTHRRL